jgi:hypothetical protein
MRKKRINSEGLVWCYGHKEYLPSSFFGTHKSVRQKTRKKAIVGVIHAQEYNTKCEHCNRSNAAYYNLVRLYRKKGLAAVEASVLQLEEAYKAKLEAYQRLYDKVGGK